MRKVGREEGIKGKWVGKEEDEEEEEEEGEGKEKEKEKEGRVPRCTVGKLDQS